MEHKETKSMNTYIKRPTQEQRILELLRERGAKGVMVWEFMIPRPQGGLGIAQYNARIWGLRRKGYVIENKKPGHFILTDDIEYEENGQRKII